MRVLRIFHAGRDDAHRERDRALTRAGAEVILVVPSEWPGDPAALPDEPFEVVPLAVTRLGDVNVNRYRFADPSALAELLARVRPDVVDLHAEPPSAVVHQVLRIVPADQPVVAYTAQNLDKRFPPPFAGWERHALARVQGLYPCSSQAASVAVGKGFRGVVRVLPLAPPAAFTPGDADSPGPQLRLLFAGRLLAHKGVLDAVRVLAALPARPGTTLTLVGAGADAGSALQLATELGVRERVQLLPWAGAEELAAHHRRAHVVLVPSRATRTWVEQFGRVVADAQATGTVVAGYASGALPEVVGAGGVLVPEGDVDALANAVGDLAQHPDHWEALRQRGLVAAAPRTWGAVAAGMMELYGEAVRGGVHPMPVRPRRRAAEAAFGPPARPGGVRRPFALPLLRADTVLTRAMGRVADAVAPRERAPAPERLRVVFLDHVAIPSGGELSLTRLIGALPDVDARVVLGEDGPLRALLEQAGAQVEVLALDPRVRDTRRANVTPGLAALRAATLTAGYTARLARRLRALDPDVVHTNSLKSGFYGCAAARLAGVPAVWHLRDRVAPDYLPRPAVWLTRLALATLPQLVIGNSQETLAVAGLPTARTPAVVIHCAYRATRPPRPARDPEAFTVGIVGRLAPWKGQDVFLRAFAAAFGDDPRARARVIGAALFGEDAHAGALTALTEELGLDGRVTFVGHTDQVEEELALLDVLVHASVLPEPFGQVVVEGMAAGLAVIASAAGGPLEIITDGVDGLLVTPADPAALAQAMRRLAEDPPLRERLGAAALVRARAFDPCVTGPQVSALYRDLNPGRRRTLRRSDRPLNGPVE